MLFLEIAVATYIDDRNSGKVHAPAYPKPTERSCRAPDGWELEEGIFVKAELAYGAEPLLKAGDPGVK